MMKIRLLQVGTLMGTLMAFSLWADEPPRTEARKPGETPATQLWRAKHVLGATISIADNVGIGKVDDIVFRDDGVIEYLIVEHNNKLITVPWEAAKFNYEKRAFTLSITNDIYRSIPTYTVQQYPDFHTPTYRAEIYQFYKLNPRQERRLERQERRP